MRYRNVRQPDRIYTVKEGSKLHETVSANPDVWRPLDGDTVVDLSKLKKAELVALAAEAGLDTSGTVKQLIARLEEAADGDDGGKTEDE